MGDHMHLFFAVRRTRDGQCAYSWLFDGKVGSSGRSVAGCATAVSMPGCSLAKRDGLARLNVLLNKLIGGLCLPSLEQMRRSALVPGRPRISRLGASTFVCAGDHNWYNCAGVRADSATSTADRGSPGRAVGRRIRSSQGHRMDIQPRHAFCAAQVQIGRIFEHPATIGSSLALALAKWPRRLHFAPPRALIGRTLAVCGPL